MEKIETCETMMNTHRSSSSLWLNCRPDIQRRINALLNYQAEYFRLRVEFYRELQQLQYVYSSQFEQILERRRKIIDGSCEPTELEKVINWSNISNLSLDHSNIQSNLFDKGVPGFWQTVLKNLDSYDYPLQSRDKICLKYLMDIRCILNPPNSQTTNFTLEFHFLPSNPFFTQTILTKSYSIRFELDESNPYRSYDGPEVDRCYGCLITWNPDHNLTIRKRTKRLRNKTTGQIRFVQVEEPIKSFFDFFSPPVIPVDGISEMTDEDQIRLEADIEFGLLLKQHVLPRAILYYTGEAVPICDGEKEDDELTSSDSSRELL
jgi:nucleosome assembly protein 1-like 1